MKKVLFIAVVAVASLASCKKDRTCTCTYTYSDGSPSNTDIVTYTEAKKGDARKACASGYMVDANGDKTTRTCELK
jgi:hypothetical protein